MKRKSIEALPYGSSRQHDAADAWFARFKAWCNRRWKTGDNWLADRAWRKLLLLDVWYLANRRTLDQGATRERDQMRFS